MKIVLESDSEDCIGTNIVREYKLDSAVTSGFVDYLRNFGEVSILSSMKQPFYSFDKEYFFTIKGLVGGKDIRVIYRQDNMELASGFLKSLLKNYRQGKNTKGIDTVRKDEKGILDIIEID